VVNDLLDDLKKEDFLVYDYADDVTILVRGDFLNTFRDLMNSTRKLVQILCDTEDLTGKSVAADVIVFPRKYKPEPTQPLRLGGRVIAFAIFRGSV
jgi:hypothetical protein